MRKGRIYILPTRFGLVFIGGAVIMVLIGSAYQNNLVNLLAFFMLGLIFVTMIQTHNNLRDVDIAALETDGGFEGDEFLVTTVVANRAKGARFNLEANLKKRKPVVIYDNILPLTSDGTLKLRSSYFAKKRGRFEIKEMKVHSIYPMGLFRAWMWLNSDGAYFVYPKPSGARTLPRDSGETDEGVKAATVKGGDDFHGHRRFQLGDSQRHVDWKARARGRPLLVKEFDEGPPGTVKLNWDLVKDLDREEALGQMSQWIEEAKAKNLLFSMVLPNHFAGVGQGQLHAVACLELLATYASELDGYQASLKAGARR